MHVRKIPLGTFLLLVSFPILGQATLDTTKKKNYCTWTGCSLKQDDPIHFDPYYNGHLCENFNPEQTDFSKEYNALRLKMYEQKKNKLQQTRKYDFSAIWNGNDLGQNGILGLSYQRIQFHIDTVTKSKKSVDTYLVKGKSKVKSNICDFNGEIKLRKIFYSDSCDYSSHKNCGQLMAEYVFYEDSTQPHSGKFTGVTECFFYLDSDKNQMVLDESSNGEDGYWNRTFVGIWSDYKTNKAKKCIWGDYRLPFTFDFDCGDGEMRVCDKYVKNGWQAFNDDTEYTTVAQDKSVIKDKWWLKKTLSE